MVHGDLSINNIVIYHTPLEHPPPRPSILKKGAPKLANSNMSTQVTQNTTRQEQASVVPALLAGLDEGIPAAGTMIDYNYAHLINTLMDKILVHLSLNFSVLILHCNLFFLLQGNLPFMPLAALNKSNSGKYIHGPAHDLESLLQTILGIMTFTNGPCGIFCVPTHHIPTACWYNEINWEQLHKDKTIDLISYNTEINAHITEYWKPFAPYLHHLILATWPERIPVSSQASHKVFKDILEEALEALKLLAEVPAKYAPISQKHA